MATANAAAAVLQTDGSLRYQGRTFDAALAGLPKGPYAYTAIPVIQRGAQVGYFRISTPRPDTRPSRDALRVCVLPAGEWSLRARPDHSHSTLNEQAAVSLDRVSSSDPHA